MLARALPAIIVCVLLFYSFLVHEMLTSTYTLKVTTAEGGYTEIQLPLFYSIFSKTHQILGEILSELVHVSECALTNGRCNNSWCADLKRDIYHASICTDTQCKQCIILRVLLFLHSMQCRQMNCLLPFCSVSPFFLSSRLAIP
jgi:hypothetical protein